MENNETYSLPFKNIKIRYYNVWNYAACEIIYYLAKEYLDMPDIPIHKLDAIEKHEMNYYFKEYVGIDLAEAVQFNQFDSATLTEALIFPRFPSNFRDIARPLEEVIKAAVEIDPLRVRSGFKKIIEDFTYWKNCKKLDPVVEAIEQLINGGQECLT